MTAAFNRVRGFMRVTVPPRGDVAAGQLGEPTGFPVLLFPVLREQASRLRQGSEGHGFHPVGEGEAPGAGIDDGHEFQAQVVEGDSDRGRQARRVDALALDTVEAPRRRGSRSISAP